MMLNIIHEMIWKPAVLALLVFLISAPAAWSQAEGKVRGFVNDANTDLPVPFANIKLDGTDLGTVASNDGYFLLNDVPPGKYNLEVSFLGYETKTEKIEVGPGQIVTTRVYLSEASEMLDDVEVSGDRQERASKVLTGVVRLDPKEITQFSVGGDADIVKAIQVLPGVVTTGDQGGQLFIRGGAPIQNLVQLDGMIVYNPFHSIGFFSVFDADIIESADVYSGGFGAEFGSRNSAVLDIRTRHGNRKRLAGKVQASTYSSKLLLEAPLGQRDKSGRAATSVLVSAKTSYLEQSSKVFYPYIETEFDGLPFNFTDIYAKITSQSDNGSRINGFGFSFNDAVRFGNDNNISWNNIGGGVDFRAVPAASSVLIDGNFSYSNYDISSQLSGQERVNTSGISGFNGGLDFTYFLGNKDEFKYGLEAIGYSTNLEVFDELNNRITDNANTTELGTYFQYRLVSERFLMEPGLRLHYYGSQSELSVEPRLGLKYNINEWLRVKASAGLYSQNLMASNSDREIINLFYGFLSGIGTSELPDNFNGEPVTSTLQKAEHLVTGVEVEAGKNLTFNLEAYLKNFSQITNVNRNRFSAADPPFVLESGLARGIDFLAKYRSRSTYVWLAYSLSKITRDDGNQEYFPFFDRRHNLNLVTVYSFGAEKNWEASLRYNFGTGFPFTPTRAYYSQLDFLNEQNRGDVSYDYTSANGRLDQLYGDLNSKRLPNYHRVDVSLSRIIDLGGHQELEVSAGATNLLNYQNIFYFDLNDNKRVDQLPIMPTVSVSYQF